MIDSINFLIRDMEWIDFKHISELGQRVKEYKNINNRTGFENKCYEFNYTICEAIIYVMGKFKRRRI